MIDDTDNRLKDWVENILDGAAVMFTPPGASQPGHGVSLYLMELENTPPPRSPNRPPLQFTLIYLVTLWGYEPEEGHRLLGELLFAAMDNAEFNVDLKPLPPDTWVAFGTIPQPSFLLRVLARRERPEPEIKYVRVPMVVRTAPLTSLEGVLLGPGDVPLAGARVEIPNMQISVRTDSKGRFFFSSLPGEPSTKLLRIRAKGRELNVTVESATKEPIVIHFDLFNLRKG